MSKIILKTAKRKTTVSRAKVRSAVYAIFNSVKGMSAKKKAGKTGLK